MSISNGLGLSSVAVLLQRAGKRIFAVQKSDSDGVLDLAAAGALT
jgi:hypothetical protein